MIGTRSTPSTMCHGKRKPTTKNDFHVHGGSSLLGDTADGAAVVGAAGAMARDASL
jgi:hypothetical protein